eukprot:Seg674.2 transcript_id=Seg674.2/GoldUCD/mRNA.D3Y31 product="hypothetical protein" protein_id=Seg674.2/GoldUCD/D3Y31
MTVNVDKTEAIKAKNPDDRNAYKKLRNEVKRELRTAEARYWNEKMQEATEGSANFWNTIKMLTKTKGKKEKIIGPLKNEDGELVFDDSEKAGLMNEFFANIGEKLAKNLDEIEKSPNEYILLLSAVFHR